MIVHRVYSSGPQPPVNPEPLRGEVEPHGIVKGKFNLLYCQ